MTVSEERLKILRSNNAESNRETRSCVKEAFLFLLNDKGYNEIRMTDIINKSGISRSGVYKNYKSKQEILMDIYKEPVDDVISALTDSIPDNLELIFRTGKHHEKAIKAIIDAGLEHNFLRAMNDRFEGVTVSFYIPLWNGMIYNSFFEWAKSGMEGSVDEVIQKVKSALSMVAESIETGLTNKGQNLKL